MAARMHTEGAGRREILAAVAEATGGMAPDPRNWAKTLSRWVKVLPEPQGARPDRVPVTRV